VTVSQDQSDTAYVGLAGLVQQQTMDGIFIKFILLQLVRVMWFKPQFFTINLVADAKNLLKHVRLLSRNNLKVCFKKVSKIRMGHVGIG